jgi:uncharacterized repeat protein (TIGR01451 family)
MIDSGSVARASSPRKLFLNVISVFVVLIMISTALFAVLASGETDPVIWTSRDEYAPGEVVYIYGDGFVKWSPVEIELYHPDLGTKTFTETPDLYGRFVFDGYVSEWVSTPDIPVNVTATQALETGDIVATTQFWDPAAYIEGYTLRPFQRWTHGDVKGYNEGDSVPMSVVLSKKHIGAETVTIEFSVDFIDLNSPTNPTYGIDYLTQYWVDPPSAPFNTLSNSTEPFSVDVNEGTITSQWRMDNQAAEGGNQIAQVWNFTLVFNEFAETAIVRFGAHLTVSDSSTNLLGASYYPGSALHVNMTSIDPGCDEGNRDVPIMLGALLTPPDMELEKECTPTTVVEGDKITFTLDWTNTGQAAASCVALHDDLPYVVDIDPTSFLYWTSKNLVKTKPLPGPTVSGGVFDWAIGYWPGTGLDGSIAPVIGYLQFTATVDTNEPGWYYNWANLTYSDDHGGSFPLEVAWCRFLIIAEPAIDIEKSGPLYAHIGDVVTYTYSVTNTGDVDLTTDVVDDVLGIIAEDLFLEAGASEMLTGTYTITGFEDDPLPNTATVTGTDEYGRTATDSASWEVDILHPEIEVYKIGDISCAAVDEVITYKIWVYNPSKDTDLYEVVVYDSLLGSFDVGMLLAGETYYLEPIKFAAVDVDPLINIATAEGEDALGKEVSDSASWTVDILHPMIFVDKWANKECAEVGETVVYMIYVMNPSEDTDVDVTLEDTMLDVAEFFTLAPGEPWSMSYSYVVQADDPDPLVNKVTVMAIDYQGHRVYAGDSWTVEIYHPMIEVTKTADKECAEVGETVTYTITVANPSSDTPMYTVVTDDMFGGVIWEGTLDFETKMSFVLPYVVQADDDDPLVNTVDVVAEDPQLHVKTAHDSWSIEIYHPMIDIEKTADKSCGAIGELVTYTITVSNPSWDTPMYAEVWDPMFGGIIFEDWISAGKSWSGIFEHVVSVNDIDPIVNWAWVNALDPQDHDVYDEDSWTVDIYHPAVTIYKWADLVCAGLGDEIQYYITVTNPSDDTPLVLVEVTDEMFGGLIWTGSLDPLGSVTITGDELLYVVQADDPDPLVNTATVYAKDPQDHEVSGESSWSIDFVHPDVLITKVGDLSCAAVGEEVTYTITVTNPQSADVMLNGTVYDDMLGQEWTFDNLGIGESVEFIYTMAMPDVDPFINTATVVATDHQDHTVSATASWYVDVVHPAVTITKEADKTCAAVGEIVTYWINVSNPSTADVWLNGTVYDETLGESWEFTNLMPGQTLPFVVRVAMPDVDPFINTAYVEAFDHQLHEVDAKDSWSVDVVHPQIILTKEADKTCAEPGEVVKYWINVTNPSGADVWLNGTVYDQTLGESWDFTNLMPGHTLSYVVYVAMPDVDPFVNTAYVEAFDHQLHEVDAKDSWSVDVVHPMIEVTKTTGVTMAHEGDTIYYVITVSVPDEADVWMNGTVTDEQLGWASSFFNLVPGASQSWTVPYLVTSDSEDPFVNIVEVEAYDHQLHLRTDSDTWTVDILHPEITVTKIGPEKAVVGQTITYYVNVTNTGDTPLFYVIVFDSLVGVIAIIPVLGMDETEPLTYTYVVPAGTGTLVNTVSADGDDVLGRNVYDLAQWEVFKYGVVKGYKYADLDQNGDWDVGELGLMNWLIILKGTTLSGDEVYMTRMTDSTGFYEFTMLDAGIYTVSEFMPSGWVNILPITSSPLEIGSGSAESCDFANIPTGSISGYKWHDVDIDGIWDAGELGIEDWTIYLYGYDINGLMVSLETQTAADGSYVFDDLLPGQYTVSEEIQDGWYAATATSVYVDVSLLVPFEILGVNFGNAEYGSISGFKWLDEYMNGYRDGNEPYLPGWTIVLTGKADNGAVIGPLYAVTDANGEYMFDGLLPGVYTVTEVLQDGWYNVTPLSREVTLIEGSDVECAKFGNVEYGSIDGWKFLDWDMDGTKDGNEPGIAGWKITIEGWLNDGVFMMPLLDGSTHIGPITIETDADGYWSFTNLLPGTYIVSEELLDGWFHTTPARVTLYVYSGSDLVDIKFGNVPYMCFDGYKVEDTNGNGRWDVGEIGIPGWTIVVDGVRNDGVLVHMELTTDADGYFATCYNMLPGEYWVSEVLVDGWMATSPSSYYFVPPMVMGPMAYDFVFLNFELGEISGYKYEDMNGDGELDAGDQPIEGWAIFLSGPVSGTTTTDADGYFEFTGLTYGTYTVTEETRDGWVHMTPASYSVPISSGSCVSLDPFLNVELSKIWGYKFEDMNSNGVWDDGEPGLPGWTITMIWDADPTMYTTVTDETGYWEFTGLMPDSMYYLWEVKQDGWTPTTQVWWLGPISSGTDLRVPDFGNFKNVDITVFKYEDVNGDGRYDAEIDHPLPDWSFVVIGPGIVGGMTTIVTDITGYASVEVTAAGTYSVEEVLQDGWCPTTPTLQYVDVLSGMADPAVAMFGNFKCVTITLFKYEDMDSDGIYDGDDEPISGWRFDLYSYWDGAFSVYTGADGTVDVTFCASDLWWIYEEARDGWCPVSPEGGAYMVYIESGIARDWYSWTEQYLYEFGNFECVEIEVLKYLDTCSNGWYDPAFGDEPLEGWYFELYGPTGELINSGWTDEDGYLSFTVCAAGIYTLVEEDRDGWSHITPLSGYYEIDILSGDRLIQAWFGNYLDVEVPIFKYEDANSNGQYDEGDSPLANWYFELERDDGTIYSGYTGEDGMLVLVVNRSGIYTLTEEDRAGWTAINPAIGMSVINVVSGIEIPTQVFGNFHDVTITVYKFEDMDGDGYYDAEDQPLSGWQYVVTGPWSGSGTVITTGTDGYASITVDRAGDYRVEELVQDGWTPTTDVVVEVMAYSGWQLKTILFGNFEDVEITVFKYEDVNSDGVYTEGVDNPLEGWLIYAFSFDTYECLVAWTGADGYGTMTLTHGGWWEIYEFVEDGWCVVSPQGGFHMYLASSGDTPDAFEFGNFRCVLIDVFKYEDANSNGVYDVGESPLGGWYFELYTSSGLLWNYGWTGETGHLYFTVCHYDEWTVVEEDREGWTHITPSDGTLTVETPSGTDPETLMFGNFMDVWIVVFKYHDRDSDGVYDGGIYPGADSPIGGWAFTIAGPGVTNAVAYTDENGYAYFLVNRAGTYTVTEEDRSGWVHVDPLSGVLDTTVDSGCQPSTLMFGNFDTVTITVFKFDDILANGIYDGDDVPIGGWAFELYEMVGDVWVYVETVYTGADGYASFVLTHAGFYMVKEVLTSGWKCITYDSGSTDFLVLGGDRDQTFEFGNFKLGKISGYKWNDIDGDGMKDAGEPGLAGWTVWFLCVDPYYLTGFKVTGADGYYEFTGLPTGVYLVWEVCQAGWVPTSADETMVQIIGHTEKEVDFLNFDLGCIDGYKYEDMDGDGLLGTGDVILPGWTIYLYESGELVDMTTTDSNGHYEFCGLGPGTYTVQEEARTGWIATNDASETFLLTSGALVTVHTFLNFELGSIWGYKFEDMNSNGVWDKGEPAVEGWPIYMVRDSLPGTYVEYTDANGWFCFDGLEGDWYYVFEDVAEAKLAGWTPTTVTWAIDTVYSGDSIEVGPFGNFEDVDLEIFKYEDMDGNGVFNAGDQPLEGWEFTVTGPCFAVPLVVETDEDGMAYVTLTSAGTYVVTEEDRAGWMHVSPASGTMDAVVASGTVLNPMCFGNFELGRVFGQKYYDWNLNGQWDEGEAGLAGWTIWLNGTLVGGGWLNVTRITGSDGSFSVDGLPAGTYVVSERFEYASAGWVPMTSPSAVLDVGSGSVTKVDFGNAVFGLVWGIKFYDKDLDGVKDLDEPGLAGWTIILEGVTDQGVPVYRETTTDGTGYYEFAEVQPGTYDVYEVVWPDWQPTTTQPVHISVAGSMVYFEIRVDLGNIRYATVYGYKFLDSYANVFPYWPNGNFDENEWGIANWVITLQGRTTTGILVDRVEYTADGATLGYYEFDRLLPGTYWVNETMQYGFYATRSISNMIMVYPFPYGQVVMRIDFGNLLPEDDPALPCLLQAGWNLWSTPMTVDGLTATGLLEAIGQAGLVVTRYDPALGRYASYVAGDGPSEDFPIVAGEGYYVYALCEVSFVLVGTFEALPMHELLPGWNFIGYSQLKPIMASELLTMVDGSYGLVVTCYDRDAGRYYSYVLGDGPSEDFIITQGNAYFLWVGGPSTLVLT